METKWIKWGCECARGCVCVAAIVCVGDFLHSVALVFAVATHKVTKRLPMLVATD